MPGVLILGVDSSTSSCKVIAWDPSGHCIAQGRAAHPLLKPGPGLHEQPAQSWWSAFCIATHQVIQQIDPARLAGICIAHQRETFVPATQTGEPLGNALVWMDERAAGLIPEIEASIERGEFQQTTGKPLAANLSLPKIIWLQKNNPGLISASSMLVDVQAYLVHELTGEWLTSFGSADPMGMIDMRTHLWSDRLLSLAQLTSRQLPRLFPPGAILGKVTRQASLTSGLPEGLPIVAGLGDGQAGLFGTGVQLPGHASISLGTSIISGFPSQNYVTSNAFRTLYAAVQNSFVLETVILSGTYLFDWLFNTFLGYNQHDDSPEQSRQLMEAAACDLPAGSQGLLLLPYWNGVMHPYHDTNASGVVIGWKGFHTPVHMYRAILEGIAFELRAQIQGVSESLNVPIEQLVAVGGGANSRLWQQIIADVIGIPIHHCQNADTASLGAAILAASALGIHPNCSIAVQAMTHTLPEPVMPDPERQDIYNHIYLNTYQNLYSSIRGNLMGLE